MRKGLIASALSVAGIAIGVFVAARLAPHFLHGGSHSPYTPVAALASGALLAVVLASLGTLVGRKVHASLRLSPLRAIDSAGGLVFGVLAAVAIIWVLGAVALEFPGQTTLRQEAQRSSVLRGLNSIESPSGLMRALARVDPFPAIAGPAGPIAAPNPAVLERPGVRRAQASVVRVIGAACGLAVEGSGWVAKQGEVVTAAHVVAGEHDTEIEVPGQGTLRAQTIAFDTRNDVAVLRVAGLRAPPLQHVHAQEGTAVAIVGYPENGPLDAVPARIGRTALVLTQDAYGRSPVLRTITTLRGLVRHGNSGGPAVDAAGRVETTVFAARTGAPGGFGVPDDAVQAALDSAHGQVSTGECVDG
jgi:S1-C subfamily serine protease